VTSATPNVLKRPFPALTQLAVLILALSSAAGVALSFSLTSDQGPTSLPPEVQSHIGKGYEFVQNGQFQQAAQEFEAALSLNPKLAQVRYQLGVSYFALQQWPDARREFELLRREATADPAVGYYLGRLDLQEENLDGAINHLEKIAAAYLKQGRLIEAEKWLKQAVELNPRDFRAPERLARTYLKAGRRAEAEQQFAVSSARRQRYNDAARQGVDCIQELTNRPLEDARATCRVLFDPADPDKLMTLGMIYGKQGYYDESLEPFKRAVALDPDSFETNYNLGLSYFRLKRYAEARPWLMKAVDLRPDFFASNALLGATLFTLKEDEAAYRVLGHACQLSPEDADTASLLFKVSMLLAHDRWSRKEYRECLDFLQKAGTLRPDDAEVQKRLAEVKALIGQKTEPKQ